MTASASAWTLRDGVPADVLAMFALDLLCFDPSFRFDLRSMRRFAQRPGAIVLVANVASALAGFVILHLERRTREMIAYIVTLEVAPGFRRSGLAAALVREAEQRAYVAGARIAGLHVHTGNEPAIRFYERAGYKRLRLSRGFYGEGLDAWSYRKALGEEGDPSG